MLFKSSIVLLALAASPVEAKRPAWFSDYRKKNKALKMCMFLDRKGGQYYSEEGPVDGGKCPTYTISDNKDNYFCGSGEINCLSNKKHPTNWCECDISTGTFTCETRECPEEETSTSNAGGKYNKKDLKDLVEKIADKDTKIADKVKKASRPILDRAEKLGDDAELTMSTDLFEKLSEIAVVETDMGEKFMKIANKELKFAELPSHVFGEDGKDAKFPNPSSILKAFKDSDGNKDKDWKDWRDLKEEDMVKDWKDLKEENKDGDEDKAWKDWKDDDTDKEKSNNGVGADKDKDWKDDKDATSTGGNKWLEVGNDMKKDKSSDDADKQKDSKLEKFVDKWADAEDKKEKKFGEIYKKFAEMADNEAELTLDIVDVVGPVLLEIDLLDEDEDLEGVDELVELFSGVFDDEVKIESILDDIIALEDDALTGADDEFLAMLPAGLGNGFGKMEKDEKELKKQFGGPKFGKN